MRHIVKAPWSYRPFSLSIVLFALLSLSACGGSSSNPAAGPLAGNWQFSISQDKPTPLTTFGASGFLQQSGNSVTGSIAFPQSTHGYCGGAASVTGTINGSNVSLAMSEGGTVLNFLGTTFSSGATMSGTYEGLAGGCFDNPTIGTWTAAQVPALSGNFTGSFTNDAYMPLVNGNSTIQVSGTLTQTPNAGSSSASLSGTINAAGYPCFSSASLTGTISGNNVYLAIFGYNGEQLGTIGNQSAPATVSTTSSGTTLTGNLPGGLSLEVATSTGTFGPCPAVNNNGTLQTYDTADVVLTF